MERACEIDEPVLKRKTYAAPATVKDEKGATTLAARPVRPARRVCSAFGVHLRWQNPTATHKHRLSLAGLCHLPRVALAHQDLTSTVILSRMSRTDVDAAHGPAAREWPLELSSTDARRVARNDVRQSETSGVRTSPPDSRGAARERQEGWHQLT